MSNQTKSLNAYTNVSRSGNMIRFRGILDGERTQFETEFTPQLFVPAKGKSKYKSLKTGKPLEIIHPGNIAQCYEFIHSYSNVLNFEICGDNKWELNFIASIFGSKTPINVDIKDIRIVTLDIEVSCENGYPDLDDPKEEIQIISVYDATTKQYHAFVQKDKPFQSYAPNPEFFQKEKIDPKSVHVHECESGEEELLEQFFRYWKEVDPDIVTGWNVRFFDMPYIWRRASEAYGKKFAQRLSPWMTVTEKTIEKWGKDHTVLDIQGVAVLDMLELYRKYSMSNQESYKLDFIAKLELNRTKVDYKEHDSIRDFYLNDWQKYVEYNIVDTDLVRALEDKLRLIELHVSVSYYARINYNDCFSQVRTWESILRHAYFANGIICPYGKEIGEKSEEYEGAYVKEPKLGFANWVMSFDLNSLYPSLIIQSNIGPETIIDQENYPEALKSWIRSTDFSVDNLLGKKLDTSILKDLNICMAANRQFFVKDRESVLVNVVKTLYEDRKREKSEMLRCQGLVALIDKELERRNAV